MSIADPSAFNSNPTLPTVHRNRSWVGAGAGEAEGGGEGRGRGGRGGRGRARGGAAAAAGAGPSRVAEEGQLVQQLPQQPPLGLPVEVTYVAQRTYVPAPVVAAAAAAAAAAVAPGPPAPPAEPVYPPPPEPTTRGASCCLTAALR